MKSVPLRACAVLSLAVFVGSISRAQKLPTLSSQTTVHADDVSLESYQQHLVRLESFLEACSQGRDSKSCDPALIGGDERGAVSFGAERRLVRYGWLRVLLHKASSKE